MAQKGGLGRGLNSLLGDSMYTEEVSVESTNIADSDDVTDESNKIYYIDLNNIKPNSSQPRKRFDEDKISELAASISEHGLIQPIVVRPVENGYEIVAGERRYRAAREAELESIPCIVRELDDRDNLLFALIENMQREDLNPIEEASAYREVIDKYSLTQEDISKTVGKSRPYITNALRLLTLPDIVQMLVASGRLSAAHARTIAGVPDPAVQTHLANLAVDEQISVRELEKLAAQANKDKKKNKPSEKSADIVAVEDELKDLFGTKVTLPKSTKKGKIEISFFSHEELERILELLRSVSRETFFGEINSYTEEETKDIIINEPEIESEREHKEEIEDNGEEENEKDLEEEAESEEIEEKTSLEEAAEEEIVEEVTEEIEGAERTEESEEDAEAELEPTDNNTEQVNDFTEVDEAENNEEKSDEEITEKDSVTENTEEDSDEDLEKKKNRLFGSYSWLK